MAIPVIMPRQGQSVESCIIAKWHKNKGDRVQPGDVLFTYETDKATFEEEAKADGTILEIFFNEGDDVPVLTNVCVIGSEGENAVQFTPGIKGETVTEKSGLDAPIIVEQVTEEKEVVGEPAVNSGGRIKISPRAKALAEKTGIGYQFANPTGPDGRIIERDIIALQGRGPVITASAKEEYMEVKLTGIRKVIAKAMHSSLSATAQVTLNTSFDASEILAYRKKMKENTDMSCIENITLNDMILYAVSRTILAHRSLNAHFLDDKMLYFNNVHMGAAVDIDRGLMVPTVFNADLKSLNEISAEVKKLAQDCQKGLINPDCLKGASFTVTNLGTLGIESFTPVLNPPQTGILGVCNIVQRVKEINGEYVCYPAMGLSLTFDHRALDGAPAARFLKDLKTNLENFSIMLVK